jgi:hypothetical protein
MIMVTLKSTTLSAICGAFLSAVTVGATSAASLSIATPAMAAEVKKYDPNCIKDCNDVVDACMGKAGHKTKAETICARNYTNCVGKCKSQIE